MSFLKKVIKSKEVSRAAKIRMCRTVIRPTAVYGCETWVLNKKPQTTVEVWDRKMLRGIFEGIKTEERHKTNQEVLDL